jgi:hypothetical protein
MLIRFAVARSRAKIWTTIGSASHSLARDGCFRGDAGKMARIGLGMSASVFLAISRLCQPLTAKRTSASGESARGIRPRPGWGGLLPASCAADRGIVSQKCRLSSSGLRPLRCAPRLTHDRGATIQFARCERLVPNFTEGQVKRLLGYWSRVSHL